MIQIIEKQISVSFEFGLILLLLTFVTDIYKHGLLYHTGISNKHIS